VKKADHLALNRAIKDYEEHSQQLFKLASSERSVAMTEFEIYSLISSEIGYGMTLIANHLLEFGEKEDA
jgi:hypothetical protein